MPGESQQIPSTGAPDPSVLTTEQLEKGLTAERDYVQGQIDKLVERLNGMDRATSVLHETVTRTPTEIQQAVGHLHELIDVKFEAVAQQFTERDTRAERESRDNKVAVDAAFAAQKEAASEAKKSGDLAIDKSERATAEKQDKASELFESRTTAISVQIADLKDRTAGDLSTLNARMANIEASLIQRMTGIEATVNQRLTAIEENKRGGTEARSAFYAFIGFLVALIVLGGFVAAAWPRS